MARIKNHVEDRLTRMKSNPITQLLDVLIHENDGIPLLKNINLLMVRVSWIQFLVVDGETLKGHEEM